MFYKITLILRINKTRKKKNKEKYRLYLLNNILIYECNYKLQLYHKILYKCRYKGHKNYYN